MVAGTARQVAPPGHPFPPSEPAGAIRDLAIDDLRTGVGDGVLHADRGVELLAHGRATGEAVEAPMRGG
jgi:hypothetical protein